MKALLVVLGLALVASAISIRHENGVNVMLRKTLGKEAMAKKNDDPALWFTQKLDHFDPFNSANWQQKYYVNSTFYRSGGPVFFHIGGEGPISVHYVSSMSFIPLAQKYHALILALEHRYYGDSHPTADMSTQNLRWLSSQQALADAANFRGAMMEQYSLPNTTRWVTFGGSYPGCLSAWARLKYPHLFYASSSVSAPVRAKLDFEEYNEVVANSLGQECTAVVRAATTRIDSMLNTATGRRQLSLALPTCRPISNYADTQVFFDSLSGSINGVVQYNAERPGDTTIADICGMLTKPGVDPVDALVSVAQRLMKENGEECMMASWNDMIASLSDTSYEGGGDGRAWTAQTCNEFGFYQTSDWAGNPYVTTRLDLNYSLAQCEAAFGGRYNMPPPVSWTNEFYGSDEPDGTRIVFSNGSIDPWHALGITTNIPPMRAVFIEGTAHCADMSVPRATDPPALTEGRQKVLDQLDNWLSE